MKKKFVVFLSLLVTVAIVASLTSVYAKKRYTYRELIDRTDFSKNSSPANEVAIAKMLINKGKIRNDASKEEIDRAVNDYLKTKIEVRNPEKDKIELKKALEELEREHKESKEKINVEKLTEDLTKQEKSLNEKCDNTDVAIESDFSKENNSSYQSEAEQAERVEKQLQKPNIQKEKLLILLVEFGDDEYGSGPLHNQIQKPGSDDNVSLWVNDFSRDHYKNMLFTKGGYDAVDKDGKKLHLESMVDYYLNQSNGNFLVDGDVYGWFKVPHSEAYYGDDEAGGGHDNKEPGTAHDLVRDLLEVAKDKVPFDDYDVDDDGVIDHLVIVHAGEDQSAGGGKQGDNALWAHSSKVMVKVPSKDPNKELYANNYIMQSEDGAIGVFCHEFAHDLGLPDEYDTNYSGSGDTVGVYSIMSSGSWLGQPAGTKPSALSPWGRMVLGKKFGRNWINISEIKYEDLRDYEKNYSIFTSSKIAGDNQNQALKVNLPDYKFDITKPYEGRYHWYSGKEDKSDFYMRRKVNVPVADQVYLSLKLWYDTEENWDFAFVQVSEDNGETWKSLSSSHTTGDMHPKGDEKIRENLPGYTGKSDGWIDDKFNLSKYSGKDILLQIRYMTDPATTGLGVFVDNVQIRADGETIFYDDMENGENSWNSKGFSLNEGFLWKEHFYMIEWKTKENFNIGLKYVYSYEDPEKKKAKYFEVENGAFIWYRNTGYTDNWVGIHPGYGFLGIVDSHPEPIVGPSGKPLKTRYQMIDCPFARWPVGERQFYAESTLITERQKEGQSLFNDSFKYWYESSPSSGLKLPQYGIIIRDKDSISSQKYGHIALRKTKNQ